MPPAIHIALLDDEVDITQLLAGYLQAQGYRITQLHRGRDLMALMPTDRVEAASAWIYRGVWRVLVNWLRVPKDPPTLPSFAGDSVASFRPSEGFLSYLKIFFWFALLIIDGVLITFWLMILLCLALNPESMVRLMVEIH